MASYSVVYRDKNGTIKLTLTPSEWFKLEFTKRENEIGSLSLDLPPLYNLSFFEIDGRIEVWRAVGAYPAYLECDTVWLIRLVRKKTDEQGRRSVHILAHDAIEILDRRIIAYQNNTSYTKKSGPADNVIKALARENLGSLATDTARRISSLVIDSDVSKGASVFKEDFSYRKLFPLMQEIASDSATAGTYLTFDVVYNTISTFRLRTWAGQRGTNRGRNTRSTIVASIENGMLSYASLAYDYTEEYNYIYAGGQGQSNNKIVSTAYNNNRIRKSPLNRREDFISTDVSNATAARAEANARLKEAQAKTVLNGHIQQSHLYQYGVHYRYGDLIVASYDGQLLDVHLDTIHIVVGPEGGEEVQIMSRNLDDTEY